MKTKLFAAALAALTLATAGAASAQSFDRDRYGEHGRYERGDWRERGQITVRKNGRVMTFDRRDRMFYRLLDRPFGFRPGLTYAYTDRCNRNGCVAFVFDGRHRRPIDRIFAPHLREARGYAWREQRGFDGNYNRFGRYDRDDRNWDNDDDRQYREGRDGRGDRDWDRDGDRDGRRDGRGS
ncbi:MAG TPA: hypothetical protein VJ748_04065 [Vitreimonas sp.]|jgi:hypothetical protein|nr:hypothetical protein [Vitreimonas sp.]